MAGRTPHPEDAATPPHASNITAAAAAVVAAHARAFETPVTERAATQRRRARSTPRGSLEARARIRRARMPAGMAGRTPHPEDAATPPHASKEPVATAAVASSQSTT
jgi:hypothetical protein